MMFIERLRNEYLDRNYDSWHGTFSVQVDALKNRLTWCDFDAFLSLFWSAFASNGHSSPFEPCEDFHLSLCISGLSRIHQ